MLNDRTLGASVEVGSRNDLIDELEAAIATGSIAFPADALKQITDLFTTRSMQYSPEAIAVFGNVMVRLCDTIETSDRARLADQLAPVPNAPKDIIRRLAFDEAITVARPVLTKSPQLSEATLIENARTKSQDHLLAISERSIISALVTDVLVDRGNHEVALSTVNNRAAHLSAHGRFVLVERSKEDGDLAESLCFRPDIPRHQIIQLFATASQTVRKRLEHSLLQKPNTVHDIIETIAMQIETGVCARSLGYRAEQMVDALHRAGDLGEARLESFASAGQRDETIIALSILCDLPVSVIERALSSERPELMLMLTKATGLTWKTTKAVLGLRANSKDAILDQCLRSYMRLKPDTAKIALQFMRLRECAGSIR